MTKKTKTKPIEATLHFAHNHMLPIEFKDEKECDEFLDSLFTTSYGYAEINKKLYVNMSRINYVTFEDR